MWLSLISLLFILGIAIVYQDFRHRLINLWLILAFAAVNISQYMVSNTIYQFLENVIFSMIYFLLLFGGISLYFFLKTRKLEIIMDSKLGWGDLLVFLAIGPCLESVNMIYFFSFGFIFSLIFALLSMQRMKTIPLAGLIVIFYLVYIPVINFLT